MKKAADDELIASYANTQSVWRTAEEFGMCGQSVHERLKKLGVIKPINVFTKDEIDRIINEYEMYASVGKAHVLAQDMGRTPQFISRQARKLGLTNAKRSKPHMAKWKYVPEAVANGMWEEFKSSKLGLMQYCKKKGFDDEGFRRCMKRFFNDEWDYVIELKAPKQTLYRLGRSVEYRVRDKLVKLGYQALRSPKSAGAMDIMAVRIDAVLFVQCKRSMLINTTKEWNELFLLARNAGAIAVVAGQPTGRGIHWKRIVGEKDKSRRSQPWEDFNPETPKER